MVFYLAYVFNILSGNLSGIQFGIPVGNACVIVFKRMIHEAETGSHIASGSKRETHGRQVGDKCGIMRPEHQDL